MRRRSTNFDRLIMLFIVFGIIGAHLGGEIGAVIGIVIGCGIGVAFWHKHEWQRGVVYDNQGRKRFMLKFCECGEIQFDGYFTVKGD